ncbi:MAG: flagellar export protein FliJ [Dehalococcoidia bacterium]
MSARPFRFEPLLHWAEQREEQQMLVLATALAEEQEALGVLEALAAERERELARMTAEARVDPEQRQVAEAYLLRLADRIDAQRGALEEVRGRVEAARGALIELEQEKQSLERLRENDEQQALEAQNRREASVVDDLNMTRHTRRAGSNGVG